MRHIVLNSYGANPVTVENSILMAGGVAVCRYTDIIPGSVKRVDPSTAIAAEWVITPSNFSTAGTTYAVRITQLFPNAQGAEQKQRSMLCTIDIPQGGFANQTAFCNAFRARWFPPSGGMFDITASGTNTIVLTASIENPVFFVEFVNMGAGAATDIAVTQYGEYARGTADYVITQGANPSDVTAQYYTGWYLLASIHTGYSNTSAERQPVPIWIWLNTADADYAAADAATTEIFRGLAIGTTQANPEIAALV